MSLPSDWLLARSSLKYFTINKLGLRWPSHYSEWEKKMENPRGLFEAPRGSWKTYFFSLAYPLWSILREKTEVLLVSDSEGQAEKNLRLMRETVDSRSELSPMRPSTRELWGVNQISFANQSLVGVMGFGTSKRGTHPKLIVNDDIEGENNKMSRDDKNRMYFGVITGMCLPDTKMATIGTPNEFGDILQQLTNNDVYSKWRRPAEINGVNQYKDIWSDEWLAFRKVEMGSINYAREMMLERIDPATQVFKPQYETLYSEAPPNFARIVTICDPAYTENDGDYTAIITNGITAGNHGYVLEWKRIRREDPGVIVNELFKSVDTFKSNTVGIKRRKGDAISYSFEERRNRENRFDFHYIQIKDTKAKADKSRIGGLVPRWEARTIHIHKNMKEALEEIYQFRFDDSHKNDDGLDALADTYMPEISQPNTGKMFMPTPENTTVGHGFYRVGRRPETQDAVNHLLRIA